MSDDPLRMMQLQTDDRPLSDAILAAITEQTGMELLAEHLLFKNFNPNALDDLFRSSATQPSIILSTPELSIIISGNRRVYIQVDDSKLPSA
ncbi:HalOD1 output domain-containing protein [Haladaptatus sp. CMAA 1911]|uniref:HalOD1 output domain-containing protein n=1 Tax=unclassified Haladaptatus TaxID=2622732 RepID=UPI0037545F4D